jgi:hypothetical protein
MITGYTTERPIVLLGGDVHFNCNLSAEECKSFYVYPIGLENCYQESASKYNLYGTEIQYRCSLNYNPRTVYGEVRIFTRNVNL